MSIRSKSVRVATSAAWGVGRLLVEKSTSRDVVVVGEYPKAGGTWIAKIVASSLGLPFIGNGVFLPLVPCVIRTHWVPRRNIAPSVVVVRDVRDVMVSLFHHRVRNLERTPKRREQYASAFESGISLDEIRTQLPAFMKLEFDDPKYGAHVDWSEFTDKALALSESESSDHVIVRYEDVLLDPVAAISTALAAIGRPVDSALLAAACALHDAKLVRNQPRYAGETTFLRAAKSGEWARDFSGESAQFIAERCNRQLIALGYESSPDWWKTVD